LQIPNVFVASMSQFNANHSQPAETRSHHGAIMPYWWDRSWKNHPYFVGLPINNGCVGCKQKKIKEINVVFCGFDFLQVVEDMSKKKLLHPTILLLTG